MHLLPGTLESNLVPGVRQFQATPDSSSFPKPLQCYQFSCRGPLETTNLPESEALGGGKGQTGNVRLLPLETMNF